MKNKLFAIFAVFALFLALGSMASASGPVIIFQDDFSSDALAANYSTQGVNYNGLFRRICGYFPELNSDFVPLH